MNRRLLLKGMGAITLYSSFPTVVSAFLSSCNTKSTLPRTGFFTGDEYLMIEQLTDTLLPKTVTPGALEVQVPYFVDLVVKNCMNPADQDAIKKGLQQMNEEAGGKFVSLSKEEKLKLIQKTDEAAFKEDAGKAWFRMVKKLSLVGYYTSKEGMASALNYVKVPGDYKACIPYKKGDKALAKTFLLYW
jgi:hypothetical protein